MESAVVHRPRLNQEPGANLAFRLPGYTVPLIDALAAREHFNVGLHNLHLFYELSPRDWHVAVEDATGEIVAFDSYNKLTDRVYMGWVIIYQLIIRADKRGMGLTHLFSTMKYNAAYHGIGNATPDSIKRYAFTVMGHKLNGYAGVVDEYVPKMKLAGDVSLETVSNVECLEKRILAYDSSILGFDRHDFLRKYAVDGEHGFCFVAVDRATNRTLGYGVLRMFGSRADVDHFFWDVTPLYADSDAVAEHLFARLIACVRCKPRGEQLYFMCPARSRLMLSLAHATGMQASGVEFRTGAVVSMRTVDAKLMWDKCYAIMDVFPI